MGTLTMPDEHIPLELDLRLLAVPVGLSTHVLAELQEHGVVSLHHRGDVLFQQGERPACIYALSSGGIRMTHCTSSGQHINMAILAPGAVFDLGALINNRPYLSHGEALNTCVVYAWDWAYFHQLRMRDAVLNGWVTRLLATQFSRLQVRLSELMTESVEQRIAHCVMRLARAFGTQTADGLLIDLPLTRRDLANQIGARLETVSRVIRGWERAGIVISKRERLWLLRQDDIATIAEGGTAWRTHTE